MKFLFKQVFSYLQGISFNKSLGFSMFFMGCVISQVDAQLLEDRGKLKTIKTESRGFLFFQKKVKKSKSVNQPSTKRKGVTVRYSAPVRYDKNEGKSVVRTSSRVKENFISRRIAEQQRSKRRYPQLSTSGPSYGKGKFSLIPNFRGEGKVGKPRYSKPANDNFISRRIEQQQWNRKRYPPLPTSNPSYGKGKFSLIPNFRGEGKAGKPRYSKPVNDNFVSRRIAEQQRNKRRYPPSPNTDRLFGKPKLTLISPYVRRSKLSISKGMQFDGGFEFRKFLRIKEQMRPLSEFTTAYQGDHKVKSKGKNEPKNQDMASRYGKSELALFKGKRYPNLNAQELYGKSRLSLTPKYVRRRNLSISGGMTYDINRRIADQFRPVNGFESNYQGDTKVKVPVLAAIQKRIGQWEKSSYKGHHTGFSKFGKAQFYKGKSAEMGQAKGFLKVPVPFIAGIYEKMKIFEYASFKGRTVVRNEFHQKAYMREVSTTISNFEGTQKVHKHKGGDPHPSRAYLSGKKFSSHKWKEKWRELNILWVRINPGKEVSKGSQVKVKTKYDKEERDLWTY